MCSFFAPQISRSLLHTVPASEKGCWVHTSECLLALLNLAFRICLSVSLAVLVQMPELQGRVGVQAHPWAEQLISAISRSRPTQHQILTSSQGAEFWALDVHTEKSGVWALDGTLLWTKPLATAYSSLWFIFCFVVLRGWAQLSRGPCLGLLGATVVQRINIVKCFIK